MKINKDFLLRHLFAFAVFLGLGGWFALDAFVRYPATPAAALYETIEKSPAPAGFDVESFKRSKISTQKIFAIALVLVAACVGLHLAKSVKSDFTFDGEGFAAGAARHKWSEVTAMDESLWKSKGILRFSGDGFSVALDSWHHLGVKEVHARVVEALASRKTR